VAPGRARLAPALDFRCGNDSAGSEQEKNLKGAAAAVICRTELLQFARLTGLLAALALRECDAACDARQGQTFARCSALRMCRRCGLVPLTVTFFQVHALAQPLPQ
jgi:hypothetical protein